jgi:hypothetical protein
MHHLLRFCREDTFPLGSQQKAQQNYIAAPMLKRQSETIEMLKLKL